MTPFVILTGFLGTGKTSLVRSLAPLLAEQKVALHYVLNDFGSAGVDAETLRDQVASLADITGACVCCEGIDALLDTLRKLKPQGRALILVEANGTTDVPALLEILAMSRSTRHCAPPMQVALVDVQCWQERGWANDLEREQVSTATHVIFTHHDLVEPERLIAVQTDFRRYNSRAVEVNASSLARHLARHCALAALPGTLSARAIMPVVDVPHDHHHDLEHHAHRFSAVEVTLAPLVSRLDFLHAIATLPADVLRAKGLVCFEDDPESLNLVQRADVRGDISLLRMERLRPAASMMVLIGAGLDATSLWQHFEALELLAS